MDGKPGGFAVPPGDGVRPTHNGCRPAVDFEPAGLGVAFATAGYPVGDSLVQQCGVVEHPFGPVEVGWKPVSVLAMGLEADGPLAGVLANEETWQPAARLRVSHD